LRGTSAITPLAKPGGAFLNIVPYGGLRQSPSRDRVQDPSAHGG
jgi:hypothetical protein